MNYKKLISYSQDIISFIMFNLEDKLFDKIEKIILFGSVARKEAANESDIDLFFEVKSGEKELEKETDHIIDKFYKSPRFTKYWSLLDIKNPVSFKYGKPAEWKDIYPSIIQEGIILYGKYVPDDLKGKYFSLFSWKNIKPESKRVTLNRKLFGYLRRGKETPGLASKYGVKKISRGAILVPVEYKNIFENFFRSDEIPVKVYSLLEID